MGGTYEDLKAWQSAMELVTVIYQATEQFPPTELYGLSSQLRRAAVSIPSNIAEGKGRFSDRDLARFLGQARGSLCEVETQLQIAQRLGYLTAARLKYLRERTAETGRLLNGLISAVRTIPRD